MVHTDYQCPACHGALLDAGLNCSACKAAYAQVKGRPILFRADNDLFSAGDYADAKPDDAAPASRKSSLTGLSVNLSIDRMIPKLLAHLGDQPQTLLVVGGGRQRGWLDPMLKAGAAHRVIYCDVDKWADVDLFCDGHDLPFADGFADVVIQTAVLEHVLYPERVAAEFARVVRPGGFVYSELPFMQQVHEGAYDFTRYTLGGHRRLLNAFEEIETGMVAGPGTALLWAIENFALAFSGGKTARRILKGAVRILFGWIKYFDHLLANKPQAMDGASCTYFMGRRAEMRRSDADIIASYRGQKHIEHI
ncbi:MAG: class I SAM-dependent methyltransferase [Sphingomonadales bacterium]|nr:class I SAM-dependent methyltransferase [Sphingomonadales bacterium]